MLNGTAGGDASALVVAAGCMLDRIAGGSCLAASCDSPLQLDVAPPAPSTKVICTKAREQRHGMTVRGAVVLTPSSSANDPARDHRILVVDTFVFVRLQRSRRSLRTCTSQYVSCRQPEDDSGSGGDESDARVHVSDPQADEPKACQQGAVTSLSAPCRALVRAQFFNPDDE